MHKVIYSGDHGPNPLVWELHILRDNGTKAMHLIPKAALDYRSAEYGIDPTDVDTLMTVLLHEINLPTREQELADPKLRAAITPSLFEADNTAEARKHHLDRISKGSYQVEVKGSTGLDTIRQNHQPNHDRIRAHKEAVDAHRWTEKYGPLPLPKKPLQSVQAVPFEVTGMKEQAKNPSPDSMMIVGSTTITTKGQ